MESSSKESYGALFCGVRVIPGLVTNSTKASKISWINKEFDDMNPSEMRSLNTLSTISEYLVRWKLWKAKGYNTDAIHGN